MLSSADPGDKSGYAGGSAMSKQTDDIIGLLLILLNRRRIRVMFIDKNNFKPFEKKVWLSSPTMHGEEQKWVNDAFEKNWITTD